MHYNCKQFRFKKIDMHVYMEIKVNYREYTFRAPETIRALVLFKNRHHRD